ncbi:hypothetical protein AMQ83_13835 [Paenibacillus riograndensis]|nr:hypothetical protein AMQ83_13835 [Paenibacillus riograndensis]
MKNAPDIAPQGGMISTGGDMAKFMRAMLHNGQAGDGRFLTEASVKAMEHTSVTIHPGIPGAGYAFETNYPKDYNGYTVVEKGGDLSGFHSNLWLMPGQNTGVFLALNSDKGNLRRARRTICCFMTKKEPLPVLKRMRTGTLPTFPTT